MVAAIITEFEGLTMTYLVVFTEHFFFAGKNDKLPVFLFCVCCSSFVPTFTWSYTGLDDPRLDPYPEYFVSVRDDAEALIQVDIVKGLVYIVACPHHWTSSSSSSGGDSSGGGVSFGAGGELLQVSPESPELKGWRDGQGGDEAAGTLARETDESKAWRGADKGFDDFK